MNPRHTLAAARIALRAAEDAEKNARFIATMHATGSNEDARKRAAIILLSDDGDYQDALRELRAAEAAVDHAQAEVDIANDDLRRAELAARERLAEALLGKRADDAGADAAAEEIRKQQLGYYDRRCTCDECTENYAKGFDIP